MFRKTVLTIATTTVIAATAMGLTASTASAGVKVYLNGFGFGYGYSHVAPAPVGEGHVEWCLNRFRSYDVSTDTFRGYDGYDHRCISPYSY